MEKRVYLGTYTDEGGEGIYSALFEAGRLHIIGAHPAVNPSYLAVRDGRLYAVEETDDGYALSFVIDGDALTRTGRRPVGGDAPCHLLSDGVRLYVSNYMSGTLSVFTLHDGDITAPPIRIVHEGSGVDPARQRGPHVHQAALTPDGAYLAVCDLGIDRVVFYPRGEDGLSLPGRAVYTPGGTGPRHAVFGRGTVWYVVGELSCDILVYEGYGEDAVLLQKIGTLRDGEAGACAALRLSPDGNRLLASVRGPDTLALYDVLPDGRLSARQILSAHGCWPRDAAFSPCGRYVLCACERSNEVSVFAMGAEGLTHLASVPVPKPTCICFG